MSQAEPGGNTKSPGAKPAKNYQKVNWCFTFFLNEEDEPTPSQMSQELKRYCKAWGFQLEKCPTTEKLHYQGWLSLKTKEYMNTLTNMFPKIHIEGMKDIWASKKYCTKEESKVGGPWDENSIFIKTINKKDFFWWQEHCFEILIDKNPDDRTIYWVHDESGNKGKTSFIKYMAVHHKACVYNNAPTKDIAFALPDDPKIILFNLSRSSETRFNYSALEALKDGMIFSSKYESKAKLFNSPHVMVFCNFAPDREAMSADRWSIIDIN